MPTQLEDNQSSSEPITQKSVETNISSELIGLVRGFFSTPVISGLARLGMQDVILTKPSFLAKDFPQIKNKELLGYALDYLVRIGILNYAADARRGYLVTELGRQIFQRSNSFLAPHSYKDYLYHFYESLQQDKLTKYDVDRLENIIGSGRTHERYFPAAVSFLKRKIKFQWIVDMGCGDGRFLEFVLKAVSGAKAIGVDLSEVSVRSTAENLRLKFPGAEIQTFASDAADISKWSSKVLELTSQNPPVLSMWFLLHEISRHDPKNVTNFLNKIHHLFPKSPLVICELVRQNSDLLSSHRRELVMPEYLLFHDISGQGVLSWPEYQNILRAIPYQLAYEKRFDELSGTHGEKEPATFVWCLNPR